MTRKFMIKLTMMIVDFIIFILVKLHANNFVSTYNSHPSPILFPHPSQIDRKQSIFNIWMDERIEGCEHMPREMSLEFFRRCNMNCYEDCIKKYPHKDDPVYQLAIHVLKDCHDKVEESQHYFDFGYCLYKSYLITARQKVLKCRLHDESMSYLQFWFGKQFMTSTHLPPPSLSLSLSLCGKKKKKPSLAEGGDVADN